APPPQPSPTRGESQPQFPLFFIPRFPCTAPRLREEDGLRPAPAPAREFGSGEWRMRFVLALLTAAAVLGWQAAARATVRIHVDLSSQTLHATSAKGGDYDWPVSTGRPGYRTPTGAYRPQRMYVMTHSSEYENAPMPHAIFFTGGYAIHGSYETSRLGQPASHGCVRLAPADAAILYEMVKRASAIAGDRLSPPAGEPTAATGPRPMREKYLPTRSRWAPGRTIRSMGSERLAGGSRSGIRHSPSGANCVTGRRPRATGRRVIPQGGPLCDVEISWPAPPAS